MNWEAIGAVGEVAAALATIATLVYLSLQIRSHSRQLSSQNAHFQTQQIQESMALQANPTVAEMVENVLYHGNEPTTKEFILLESYLVHSLAVFRNDYFHYKSGYTSKQEWEARKSAIPQYFSREVCRRWWETSKHTWETDFVNEIDAIISTAGIESYRGFEVLTNDDGRDAQHDG